jgi:hypothetical protein
MNEFESGIHISSTRPESMNNEGTNLFVNKTPLNWSLLNDQNGFYDKT